MDAVALELPHRRGAGPVARALRGLRSYPVLLVGLAILLIILVYALSGPYLVDLEGAHVGAAPPNSPPSSAHPLGTDAQGRDVLAVLTAATPQTVKVALIAGVVGLGLGALLGLVSGYFGGLVDSVIRLLADVLITIPTLAILVVVATSLRTISVELMGLVVASMAWMYPTRAIRAQALSLRERGYVQIARLNGVEGLALVITEVLPNLLPYVAASFVATVSHAVLTTIGLEALGLGPQNTPTLGMMIYWAQYYGAILRGMWWWWVPPIVLVALIFIGLLLTSVGMDRLANARLRGVE